MNKVPVFYATNEGQTRLIAERISAILRERGFASDFFDVGSAKVALDWKEVKAAILVASVHVGKYQSQAFRFARENRDRLNSIPSAFFGVSLSAASRNADEREAARSIARSFCE